jgi:hypothetical protein
VNKVRGTKAGQDEDSSRVEDNSKERGIERDRDEN